VEFYRNLGQQLLFSYDPSALRSDSLALIVIASRVPMDYSL
jgi:hypothetical protein